MFRKALAVMVALLIAVGSVFAEEIKAVFVKVDGDKLIVKVEDKEKTFKTTDKTVVKAGKKEWTFSEWSTKAKEGAKLTLTVDKETVSEIKVGGKKDN